MRLNIKGIHVVTKRLKDGTPRFYYRTSRYAGAVTFWTEDSKRANIQAPAFIQAYTDALGRVRKVERNTFRPLIHAYRKSVVESVTLRDSTRKQYLREIDPVEEKWGSVPLGAFNDRRIRGRARAWRDEMAHMPRTADALIACLSRICQHAYDGGELDLNHIAGIPKLYRQNKDQAVWTQDEINRYLTGCSDVLRWQFGLARYTGLRRGDQVRLPLKADKGDRIEWETGKRGRHVVVPIVPELRAILDEMRAHRLREGVTCTALLFNSQGKPWTADGLSASTQRQRVKRGVKKTMHRLRGNAVLSLAIAGFSDEEIAHIVGWSLKTVSDMRRIYIDQNEVIRAQITRLSDHRA